MITGDHPATANQIAHELGIGTNGNTLSGDELSRLSAEELAAVVEDVSVYARVSPEHKLKVVEALQRRGHVVAMTGDGVNDAPALKKANIGVTMGVAGRPEWQTVIFTTLTMSQMANALAVRSTKDSLFRIGPLSNQPLVLIVVMTLVLQTALIYLPVLQKVFSTTPLSAFALFFSVLLSSLVFWGIELQKLFARRCS